MHFLPEMECVSAGADVIAYRVIKKSIRNKKKNKNKWSPDIQLCNNHFLIKRISDHKTTTSIFLKECVDDYTIPTFSLLNFSIRSKKKQIHLCELFFVFV